MVGIYIAPKPERRMQPVTEVVAVAGRGLQGDRYFKPVENGNPTAEITLIESEAIEAAAAESGVDIRLEDTRRNVITSGVRLDDLLGKRFLAGGGGGGGARTKPAVSPPRGVGRKALAQAARPPRRRARADRHGRRNRSRGSDPTSRARRAQAELLTSCRHAPDCCLSRKGGALRKPVRLLLLVQRASLGRRSADSCFPPDACARGACRTSQRVPIARARSDEL